MEDAIGEAQGPSLPSPVRGRILLVEGDEPLGRILATALGDEEYLVDVATTAEGALEVAAVEQPDVVILDLGIADLDGIELCRRLRRWYANPIVVLGADADESRKIVAFDEGADDYLTKPFSMPELLARLRVAFRHRHTVATVGDGDILQVGALMIDTGARAVIVAETPIDLRHKEYELLVLLARNVGKVMTHQAISSRLWGRSAPPGRGGSLRWHVMQLRKKLAEGHQSPDLLTEPGVGYRLALPEVDRRPSAAGRQRRRVATAAPLL